MSSGQLLIPIEYLEVPLPAACFLVRPPFWNKSAPLLHNQEKGYATVGCDKYELGFPERLDKLLLKIENTQTLLIKIMKYICWNFDQNYEIHL